MKVKNLINELSKYDGNVNIGITTTIPDNEGHYPVFAIQGISEKSPFNSEEEINEILITFVYR